MSIVLLAVGSRGDVTPMVALGRELQRRGEEVTVVALRDYEKLVTGAGLNSAPVQASFADATIPATALASSGIAYTKGVTQWLASIAPQVAAATLAAVRSGDTVVAGLLSFDDADALRAAYGCRVFHALYAPLLPTRSGSSSLLAARPGGDSLFNQWLGAFAVLSTARMCTTPGRALRASLDLRPTSARGFLRLVRRTPTFLAASPTLIPFAADWPSSVVQTGAWLDDEPAWQPSAELASFLGAGAPPVFVSCGSPWSADTDAVELIAAAAAQADTRVIIGTSASLAQLPPNVHLLGDAPYRHLFPLMAAVVHHGGAGTVTEALLAGVPSGTVPLGADQPFFGRRLHELGVGPEPLPRRDLTADRLAALLVDLTGPSAARYRDRAAALRSQLTADPGVTAAANTLRT